MQSETSLAAPPLVPVRTLHNFVYCPRLCYLQWVEHVFVENEDTILGDAVHNRVDKPSHVPNAEDVLSEHGVKRSIWLESARLGITGVIDYAETSDQGVILVEYKKGSPQQHDDGPRPKENDAVQLAAHALLLREHGHQVKEAYVYYAAARMRVPVDLIDQLLEKTLVLIASVRAMAATQQCPAGLQNDVRCLYCSAYPICLPDESAAWLRTRELVAGANTTVLLDEAHRLVSSPLKRPPRPACDPGDVLILQTPRAYVGVRNERIVVSLEKEDLASLPTHQVRAIYLYGPVQCSTQAIHHFLEFEIPVAYFSSAGRFLGMLTGLPASGVDARLGQYDTFRDSKKALQLAKPVIYAKIHNQRVMLMRNGHAEANVIRELAFLRDRTEQLATIEELLGHEGAAAHLYFQNFAGMLSENIAFEFTGRNKRPPVDPVNALLSWSYSTLVKELTGVLFSVGLDPFLGFMHQPRYGRPALALDIMEEFRPLIADSTVISMINRREVTLADFSITSRGVMLKDSARHAFWRAYFRRMDAEVSHPEFGYRMSYRRMLEVQARQIWRHVRNEAPLYIGFTTR